MWDKIKQIVSPIAPVLGGMIGGPVGAAAGTILKQTLLGSDKASDDELLHALQGMTPEQQTALKQAEYNYKLEMERIGLQYHQVDAADRADARQRNAQISSNEKLPPLVVAFIALTPTFLSYINVIGFFFIALMSLYFMHVGDISTVEVGLLSTLVGYGISEAKQTNTFHFGGSSSLRKKDN